MLKSLVLGCLLLSAALAPVAWAPVALAQTESAVLDEPLHIAPGAEATVEFGTVPQRDTTVLLEIWARMDYPGLSGSSLFMELTLNGRPVRAAVTRTVQRLQNKPVRSKVTPDLDHLWVDGTQWRVIYAPDFEQGLAQTWYADNPYRLVLDITDLTNPAAENRLSIHNTATAAAAKRANASLDLVIGKLIVRTQPGESPTMSGADRAVHEVNRGEPGAPPAEYRGELLPGGALALEVAGRRYVVDSAFSYPNAGFNRLGEAPAEGGQAGWAPAVDGGTVTAAGPDYSLSRTVRFEPGHVRVDDTLTNRHADRKLGVIVRHGLRVPDEATVRLAGNGDPAVSEVFAPGNPSVHLGVGAAGLGLICEDDVFRCQALQFFDPETREAGLRTESLLLNEGETKTLSWSVYPVASPAYYDFINLVRADWGSNYPVEGAWMFFTPETVEGLTDEELAARIERLGIRYACSWGGWVDRSTDAKRIGFGTEVCSDYWAPYRARLKEATAKLHRVSPGIKVLIYYDSQRDTYADAGERYPDSKLTNAKGEHLSTDWSKVYSLTWSMVATTENRFGRAMLDVIDCYMDELGADGLYWDEMEVTGYNAPLLTYSQPDGHSCLIDPQTYELVREVGNTILLGEGHRLAVIDRTREKGGVVMGNGPTNTKDLLARQVQRMVEIQHNDYWHYQGNLDTPLGYASSPVEFDNVTRALSFATLLVGTRTDYPYDISRYLYPLTPIELHAGYLLGRERIVTQHSGRYGWPGEAAVPCTVYRFDTEGKLADTRAAVAGEGDARLPIELGEGEVAVIVRE